MGYDFSSDERYQSDHTASPVIEAKDKRIAELEALCADAYGMVTHGPASEVARENFIQRIRSTLGWKIQL